MRYAVQIGEPKQHMKEFKLLMKAASGEKCETGVNLLRFHQVYHRFDDLKLPRGLDVLVASLLEGLASKKVTM